MYDSGITVSDLIQSVIEEAEMSIEIPIKSWYRWLNACEQFLYTELFNDHSLVTIPYDEIDNNTVHLLAIPVDNNTDTVRYDDIAKVYCDDIELDKGCEEYSHIMYDKPMYYTDNNGGLVINPACEYVHCVRIVYRMRPKMKHPDDDISTLNVPIEFVDMVCAKLRGEAYKIANEDGLSAKWLNDYNTQLENLKVWVSERVSRYGE